MVATIIFSNSADAAKVDIYRDAILNKTFTIKYEIANPPVFETNKNAVFFDGKLQSAQTSLVLNERYNEWYREQLRTFCIENDVKKHPERIKGFKFDHNPILVLIN